MRLKTFVRKLRLYRSIGLIFIIAWELANGRATDTPSNYRDTRGGRPVYRCALCGGEHPRSRCPGGDIHAGG